MLKETKMHANDTKKETDWGALENIAFVFHAVAAFRQLKHLGPHYQKLKDQGFEVPAYALRFLDPVPHVEPEPVDEEPEAPQDPIDLNVNARDVLGILRDYARLDSALKPYKELDARVMERKGELIKLLLFSVVQLADDEGVVVTINQRYPNGDLGARRFAPAMGAYTTHIETRWKRPIYQHFMALEAERLRLEELAQAQQDAANAAAAAQPTDRLPPLTPSASVIDEIYQDFFNAWPKAEITPPVKIRLLDKKTIARLENDSPVALGHPMPPRSVDPKRIHHRDWIIHRRFDQIATLKKSLPEEDPKRIPPQLDDPSTFQMRVMDWVAEAFIPMGMDIFDLLERTLRFYEEATELAQSFGLSEELAEQVRKSVYAKDVGERNQEVGGTMTCLAALCKVAGINMHFEGEKELARIWTKIPQIRQKNLGKIRSIGTTTTVRDSPYLS